jgi:hypothetical protein
MTTSRIAHWALLCALAASAPALAQFTTIGPDTPYVTEYQESIVATTNNFPDPEFFTPTFTPVALGSSGTGFDPALMGLTTNGCPQGCYGYPGNELGFDMFAVQFAHPVSLVNALQASLPSGNVAELLAFDSSGQLVTDCFGGFDGSAQSFPNNCYHLTSISSDGTLSLGTFTVSSPAPNISTVLFGGVAEPTTVGAVSFGAPEPDTCSLLALAIVALILMRRATLRRTRSIATAAARTKTTRG